MNLIVLAAGKGTRLGGLTKNSPKVAVLLPNGHTLLEYHVHALEQASPIEKMLIISGFAADVIEAEVAKLQTHKPIHTQFNPFYAIAGPIVSVWMARSWMEQKDFLLCNGDTFYSPQAFAALTYYSGEGILLAIERDAYYGKDGMKVELLETGHLKCASKNMPYEDAQGASTGLLLVKGAHMRHTFVNTVNEMLRHEQYLLPGSAWHTILNVLLKQGIPVETVNVAANDWHEVDTIKDTRKLDNKLQQIDYKSMGFPFSRY